VTAPSIVIWSEFAREPAQVNSNALRVSAILPPSLLRQASAEILLLSLADVEERIGTVGMMEAINLVNAPI
jgi:hypothetical protein